jgi:hypothetical protein
MLLLLGSERTSQPSSQASGTSNIASPTPTPHCWIYDKIYPVTEAAFKSQHVTLAERKEIEKWAAPASPSQERLVRARSPWARPPSTSEQHLVRWMRDRSNPGGVFVFVAQRIEWHHRWWVVLNTNVIINPVECEVNAYSPE